MPAPSWDLNPDRLRANPQQIAEVEARIRAVPPHQRSNYQLRMMGIEIPPGYRVEPNGKLKYVAVDNSQPWYNDPKVMFPAIIGGGLTMGALGGAFGGGGAGVGASGTGAGLNAAAAGNAAHAAGGGLMMGSGALMPTTVGGTGATLTSLTGAPIVAGGTGTAEIPTIPSRAFGSNDIPTIPSRQIGNGMSDGYGVADLPSQTFDLGSGRNLLQRGWDALNGDGDGGGAPDWLKALFAAMAGLQGDRGPSDEERAYEAQATRLLRQQEQRTQFQNPLYEATTRMAFGLLPNMGNNGQPYPMNSMDDVKVPTLEELIAAQRRS